MLNIIGSKIGTSVYLHSRIDNSSFKDTNCVRAVKFEYNSKRYEIQSNDKVYIADKSLNFIKIT